MFGQLKNHCRIILPNIRLKHTPASTSTPRSLVFLIVNMLSNFISITIRTILPTNFLFQVSNFQIFLILMKREHKKFKVSFKFFYCSFEKAKGKGINNFINVPIIKAICLCLINVNVMHGSSVLQTLLVCMLCHLYIHFLHLKKIDNMKLCSRNC